MRARMRIDSGTNGDRPGTDRPIPRPAAFAKGGRAIMIKVIIFFVVWFIVMRFLLPRLGVPT